MKNLSEFLHLGKIKAEWLAPLLFILIVETHPQKVFPNLSLFLLA